MISPSLQRTLDDADSYTDFFSPKVGSAPVAQDYNYVFGDTFKTTSCDNDIAACLKFKYQADLYGSYDIPAFWYERLGVDWLIMAPKLSVQASSKGEITIQLWIIKFII